MPFISINDSKAVNNVGRDLDLFLTTATAAADFDCTYLALTTTAASFMAVTTYTLSLDISTIISDPSPGIPLS